MKALIIAENDEVIERISSVVKANGYDTIVYHWLLKALDNIEEIAPHLIVICTKDYPRHWKTLVQFSRFGFGGCTPDVILYTAGHFDATDVEKANILHVRGFFESLDLEGLDAFRAILTHKDDADACDEENTQAASEAFVFSADADDQSDEPDASAFDDEIEDDTGEDLSDLLLEGEIKHSELPIMENDAPDDDEFENRLITVEDLIQSPASRWEAVTGTDFEDDVDLDDDDTYEVDWNSNGTAAYMAHPQIPCSLVFTNPITGALVTGISQNFDGSTVEFIPDFDMPSLTKGTKIASVSVKTGETITAFKATVVSAENSLVLKLV